VQQSVNQALGMAGCTTGDIDNNGFCNVIDVQRVVNAALGVPVPRRDLDNLGGQSVGHKWATF